MTAPALPGLRVRHRIRVTGVVQGVGFRPFVYRLAVGLQLAGHVGNDSDGVFVEVEGAAEDVAAFGARLRADAPGLARVDRLEIAGVEPVGESGFAVVASRAGDAGRTYVSPDVAMCDACRAELLDPADRRFRYPFINCTDCGPRFTITRRLPYDRPSTTMAGFPLCPDCSREYHDPADRRFHAEPVACAVCGPRLWFEPSGTGTDPALAAAQRVLAGGGIVAVKGLGGFHLACDATSGPAVAELRRRKHRADKPLAVMVADLDEARRLARVDAREAALLTGRERPIVLLHRRPGAVLAGSVAPGSPYLGVMLPYTPIHELLFAPVPGWTGPGPRVLVMTSGNLTDEPICYDDDDARLRLGPMVDGWLTHDRPIHVPCDDSVVRVEAGDELPIRRSRGYAPLPVRLPFDSTPLIAHGGDLKNTFCLTSGRDAWMSQHLGDMGTVESLRAFARSARQFSDLYGIEPGVFAADAHPGYHSAQWAEEHAGGRPVERVQHHHAHVAAVMAEHGLGPGARVIGFAFDGTGYGADGAIWGGEVLVAGYRGFDRAAHLRYVPLPGGDATIRKPYRSALAHLWAAGIPWTPDLACVRAADQRQLAALERQLQRGVLCVPTSSMGRLFDAVSSLLGLRHTVSYEGQAAIEVEVAADGTGAAPVPTYEFTMVDDNIDPGPVLRAIVGDLSRGASSAGIAAGFHASVGRLIGRLAEELCGATGIDCVALSGGVFQNVLLTRLARAELAGRGLRVLTHRLVPPNDGGLALGQAVVAAARHQGAGA